MWPGWFAQGTTDLYVYVDSWNAGVAYGAVDEADETNNRAEIHNIGVTGPNPVQVTPNGASSPTRDEPANLPRRPQLDAQ